MKKAIFGIVATSLVLGFGGLPAFGATGAKRAVDDRMHSVNDLVKKKGLMQEALKGVSVETGVPSGKWRRCTIISRTRERLEYLWRV